MLVDCLTDSRVRTAARVRDALVNHGGRLGAAGSVAYLFNEVGLIVFAPGSDGRRIAAVALDAGAEDVIENVDGSVEVLTEPCALERVQAVLAARGLPGGQGEITFRAHAEVELEGVDAEEMVQLIDDLEDMGDVQNVYSNAAIPSEILARV